MKKLEEYDLYMLKGGLAFLKDKKYIVDYQLDSLFNPITIETPNLRILINDNTKVQAFLFNPEALEEYYAVVLNAAMYAKKHKVQVLIVFNGQQCLPLEYRLKEENDKLSKMSVQVLSSVNDLLDQIKPKTKKYLKNVQLDGLNEPQPKSKYKNYIKERTLHYAKDGAVESDGVYEYDADGEIVGPV